MKEKLKDFRTEDLYGRKRSLKSFQGEISILFLTEVLFDPFAAGIWIS